MRWSQTLIPTLREDPQDAEIISHKLLIRGGFIRKLIAGAYSYLPLGFRVLSKVQDIIRVEMKKGGAQEVLLPALQPIELWTKTGRDKDLADVMIKFRDRHEKTLCLGPTHEEVITSLVGDNVSSYKNLPKILFQIQTKFRDEIRPRFGVMRSCEFIMKDAYSFDVDKNGLEKNYQKMYDAYCRIFERCGLPYVACQADPGVMGGGESHEFMIPSKAGEDIIGICKGCGYSASKEILTQKEREKELKESLPCPKCNKKMKIERAIEIGHTFKLGTKYSDALGARFSDVNSKSRPMIMGCYGIGVNRIPAASIEVNHDKDGIIWPKSISPYEIAILPLNVEKENLRKFSEKLYTEMCEAGLDVIIDDRPERAGVKFKDADLIGFPIQVIIGQKNLEKGKVELKIRKNKKSELVDKKDVIEHLSKLALD